PHPRPHRHHVLDARRRVRGAHRDLPGPVHRRDDRLPPGQRDEHGRPDRPRRPAARRVAPGRPDLARRDAPAARERPAQPTRVRTGTTYSTRGDVCEARTATFQDPYTGETIDFRRGNATSMAVQIDHVVPLLDAWRKGARTWDDETRRQFANDPLTLLASDGPANQSKGARDAPAWLPPNHAFRCPYGARQIAVKTAYELAVTPSESEAMARVLEDCPAEPLPAG